MGLLQKGEILYLMKIRDKEGVRIFESEVQKKIFLDTMKALQANTEKMQIYGYCVLDDAAFLLMAGIQEEDIHQLNISCMKQYERRLYECGYPIRADADWEIDSRFVDLQEMWETLIRLHYLPVMQDYVIWPENYWWSSYQEYLTRNWMPFQTGRMLYYADKAGRSAKRKVRRMHLQWKQKHPEIYLQNHANVLP